MIYLLKPGRNVVTVEIVGGAAFCDKEQGRSKIHAGKDGIADAFTIESREGKTVKWTALVIVYTTRKVVGVEITKSTGKMETADTISAGKGGHPSKAVILETTVGNIALKTQAPSAAAVTERQTTALALLINKGSLIIVVFLPHLILVTAKDSPAIVGPGHSHDIVPAMACTADLVTGLGKIGVIGIKQYIKVTKDLPVGTKVDAAFVLNPPAGTEAGREKG